MRYLMATLGNLGDAGFFGVLADALVQRGHEVIVYASPALSRLLADSMARIVTIEADEGLGVGDGLIRADDDNHQGLDALMKDVARLAPAYVAAMQHDIVLPRTVVVGTGLGLVHRLLAELHGVPVATLHQTPVSLPSLIQPARLARGRGLPGARSGSGGTPPAVPAARAPGWLDGLRGWWAERSVYRPRVGVALEQARLVLGLRPLTQPVSRWLKEGDVQLALFARDFALPPADWPAGLQLVGFGVSGLPPPRSLPQPPGGSGAGPAPGPAGVDGPDSPGAAAGEDESPAQQAGRWRRAALARLPDELRAFLADDLGVAPVVFAGGPADAGRMDFFVQSVLAVSRIGVRGILLCPQPRALPRHLPDNILAVGSADLAALLSLSGLLVHQGSVALAAQALMAGVPQLCCPLLFEQFDTSARCAALGVAAEIRSGDYRAQAVAGQVHALLYDKALQARCRQLADRLDTSQVLAACCTQLEQAGS